MKLKIHKLKIVLGKNKAECGRWSNGYLVNLNTEWEGVTCLWCLAKKAKDDVKAFRLGIR